MNYKSRSFRIDDEVYEAIQKLPVSLNRYLRESLLGQGRETSGVQEIIENSVSRFMQLSEEDVLGPKLSKERARFKGPLLRPKDRTFKT